MNLLAQQAAAGDVPNWVQIVAQLGIGAVLLWYFGQKLVPALMAAQAAAITAFTTEMKAEREAHADALKARDDREETRETRLHERIDRVAQDVTTLVARKDKAA